MTAAARISWMDSLRGAAVLLILVFHASLVQGYENSPAPAFWANDAAGPYRVPALMFASGLLLSHSLRKPPREYLVGKVRSLLWPWLLWTAAMVPLVGPSSAASAGWWLTGTHTWFLSTLFLLYVAALSARRLPAGAMAVACFVAYRISEVLGEPSGHFAQFGTEMLWFGGFFFAGAALQPRVARGGALWALVGTGVVACAWAVYSVKVGGAARPLVLGEAASLTGVIAACLASARLPGVLPVRVLQWVGRNSIVVYVVHWPVLVAMAAVGVEWAGWSGLVARASIALVVCLVAIALRPWTPWLYQLPSPEARRDERPRRSVHPGEGSAGAGYRRRGLARSPSEQGSTHVGGDPGASSGR